MDKRSKSDMIWNGFEILLQSSGEPILGVVTSGFFNYRRDKQMRKLEDFVNEVNKKLIELNVEVNQSLLKDNESLVVLIEETFSSVIDEPIQEKLKYLKQFFVNNIFSPTDEEYEDKLHFLYCLKQMGITDCNTLLTLESYDEPISLYKFNVHGVSETKKIVSFNRLRQFGFVTGSKEGMQFNSDNIDLDFRVALNDYGKEFIEFCLKESHDNLN
ncbi:hypothetical protein LPB41_23965 [Thalassospira sp. MA62]|nr:hypothetical protein [Thalassospira sp. MA62]